MYEDEDYGDHEDRIEFADPGGKSALRAATHDKCPGCKRKVGRTWEHCAHCARKLNPRCLPCPTCGTKNVLTPADKAQGYQCDGCADRAERGCD